MTSAQPTAAVLLIGDEILSGRTKDKNLGFIADYMAALGIDLRGLKNTRARWLELLYKHPEAKAIQDLARLYM